jgi:threonyl-tRNA synthetase
MHSSRAEAQVMTPMVYSNALWKQSGHYDHYSNDMFFLQVSHFDSHIERYNFYFSLAAPASE